MNGEYREMSDTTKKTLKFDQDEKHLQMNQIEKQIAMETGNPAKQTLETNTNNPSKEKTSQPLNKQIETTIMQWRKYHNKSITNS